MMHERRGGVRGIAVRLVVGLPLLIFGTKEVLQIASFVTRARKTDGIVVEMRKGRTKYCPRIRFHTSTGETIEFVSGNGSNPPMYKVNAHVPVLYSDVKPHHAQIDSFIEIWLGPIIYAAVGLLLLIPCAYAWVRAKSWPILCRVLLPRVLAGALRATSEVDLGT